MSVGFRQRTVEEIREELRRMSDEELPKHGKRLRALCKPDPLGQIHKPWAIQLKEERKEWKRRHSKVEWRTLPRKGLGLTRQLQKSRRGESTSRSGRKNHQRGTVE